jgi:hypothetical protein
MFARINYAKSSRPRQETTEMVIMFKRSEVSDNEDKHQEANAPDFIYTILPLPDK